MSDYTETKIYQAFRIRITGLLQVLDGLTLIVVGSSQKQKWFGQLALKAMFIELDKKGKRLRRKGWDGTRYSLGEHE